MITSFNQRWRSRRASYRPAGETIRVSDYEVAEIEGDVVPKAFVLAHHYSGTFPAARRRFGLYRRGVLVGVAIFSHPCNDRVLTSCLPGTAKESLELGRFVLLDEVPGNGETWTIARCFEVLRKDGFVGVVSFSDPVPREDASGRRVFGGHVGRIYQASNAVYLGRKNAQVLRLLPDGRCFNHRTEQKIRGRERGWRYAVDQLIAHGARPPTGDLGEWLQAELPRITRRVRHKGNHKYVWAFDRAARKVLPASLPYPKVVEMIA